VRKGKLFRFFNVGFVCIKKPNVLDRAVGFQYTAQNLPITIIDILYYSIADSLIISKFKFQFNTSEPK
jgi:hypothetical protein